MSYLQKHNKLIPIVIVALLLGIAGFDLFTQQQDNSDLVNSGTRLDPTTISGRTACEVPIPDVSKSQQPKPNFEARDIYN